MLKLRRHLHCATRLSDCVFCRPSDATRLFPGNEHKPSYTQSLAVWYTALLSFLISGVGLWVLRPHTGLLHQSRMIGVGDCGEIGGMKIGRGNRSTRRKPVTTNPTWLDPGLNPGRRGGKPATNRLSYGAARYTALLWLEFSWRITEMYQHSYWYEASLTEWWRAVFWDFQFIKV
jgi:hypothetical protein